jgi:hypothetical protein
MHTQRLQPGIAIIVLLWTVAAVADPLPHPNAAAINAEVAQVFSQLDALETTWLGTEGRYQQTQDAATVSDCTTQQPIDPVRWPGGAEAVIIGSYYATYYLTTYRMAESRGGGIGFIVEAQCRIGDAIWRRSRLTGPELPMHPDQDDAWWLTEVLP